MISAVGVQGNIENLGLEALGVKTDRGFIAIDGYGRTNVPGIYAIGDVAGPPMLAHKAEHEGVICVEKIAGLPNVHPMDKIKIPGCTYCHPQVASVGLTEAKAKEPGPRYPRRPLSLRRQRQGDRAWRGPGLVKTIFDKKTGQLLGAHMVGAEVTELIQGFVVAMNLRDHRGRTDAHDLPASDPVGNDEGKRARRLWPGAERVMRPLLAAVDTRVESPSGRPDSRDSVIVIAAGGERRIRQDIPWRMARIAAILFSALASTRTGSSP